MMSWLRKILVLLGATIACVLIAVLLKNAILAPASLNMVCREARERAKIGMKREALFAELGEPHQFWNLASPDIKVRSKEQASIWEYNCQGGEVIVIFDPTDAIKDVWIGHK